MKRNNEIRELLIAQATRSGSLGFSISDVSGPKRRSVDQAARSLVDEGMLFRGKIGHRTMRLFAEESWAKAYESEHRVHNKSKTVRLDPSQDAVYPVDEMGNPLYKFTKCESRADPFEAQLRNRSRWSAL